MSDQSLCSSLEYSMSVKLLTEHHLEFLCLKGGCTDSSESTLVKMPLCWKNYEAAQMVITWAISEGSDKPVHLTKHSLLTFIKYGNKYKVHILFSYINI